VLYRTAPLRPSRLEGDLVVLASGSAAHALAALPDPPPAVSIGPETTRVALAVGLVVLGEAETHDVDGLVAAVAQVLGSDS
jgi:uroporphyrinogen-III synthase